MNAPMAVRWLRFNAAGLLGVAVQLGALALFTKAGFGYIAATLAAVECAVLHNFLWHERWIWKEVAASAPERWLERLLKFHVANGLVSLFGNALLMAWLVGLLHGPVVLSNLIAIIVCGTVNFLAGDLFVFSVPRQPRQVAAHPKTD